MDKLRIAIIGFGAMGQSHARTILTEVPEARLTAVVTTHEDAIANLRAMPGGEQVRVFPSAEALFASRVADAVIISSVHRLHAGRAIAAFRAGLHVLLEKPVGVTTLEAAAIEAEAERTGLAYAAMFNVRTYPIWKELRRIVSSGEMGELRRVSYIVTDWFRAQSYYDSAAWRATWKRDGGGVLFNQAPHSLDPGYWRRDEATLALDGLQKHACALVGRRPLVKHALELAEVVGDGLSLGEALRGTVQIGVRRAVDTRRKGPHPQRVGFLGRERHREVGAAMEGTAETDHVRPSRRRSGDLYRILVALGAGVGKEGLLVLAPHGSLCRQPLGKLDVALMPNNVEEGVKVASCLVADRCHDLGMRVADVEHPHATNPVKKAVAIDVLDHRPVSPSDKDRVRCRAERSWHRGVPAGQKLPRLWPRYVADDLRQ